MAVAANSSNGGVEVATYWLVAVTAVAAVATAVMAFMTWRAATKTATAATATTKAAMETARAADAAEKDLEISKELVAASQRQAEAAARALQANISPLVVFCTEERSNYNVPVDIGGNTHVIPDLSASIRRLGDAVVLAVKVRNIGQGAAHIGPNPTDIELRQEGTEWIMTGKAISLLLARDETTQLYFGDVWVSHGQIRRLALEPNRVVVDVRVRYADISRARWIQSRMRFRLRGANVMKVDASQEARILDFVELELVEE